MQCSARRLIRRKTAVFRRLFNPCRLYPGWNAIAGKWRLDAKTFSFRARTGRALMAIPAKPAAKPVKRPPLPVVLLANDVLDGDVVFHSGATWSLQPDEALVASDDAAAATLEAVRDAAEASGEVIEPYLVTVAPD